MKSLDVQILQTAASLENLAVSSHESAARSPFVAHGNPALRAFITRSRDQHAAHAKAFNAAAVRAGGAAQHAADPRYAHPVSLALASLTGTVSIVSLLESLEDVKAQTYTRYASLTSSNNLRSLYVSVAAVEAQHRAFLLATLQLLNIGAEELISAPDRAGRLPGAIGTGSFPHAFYPTAQASAIDEGSVR